MERSKFYFVHLNFTSFNYQLKQKFTFRPKTKLKSNLKLAHMAQTKSINTLRKELTIITIHKFAYYNNCTSFSLPNRYKATFCICVSVGC